MLSSGEILRSSEALAGEVYDALRKILGPAPSIREALEVKWILLLVISKMRELGDPAIIEKDTWVEEILAETGSEGGLREESGETIAKFIETAPWGLQKQDAASSLDTVRSVNAVSDGVVAFTRQLAAELKKAEEMGVVLAEFDVEEAGSGGEEDEENEEMSPVPAKSNGKAKKPKATIGKPGPGNHGHPKPIIWTTPEHIGLLELYQANPNRKTVSHPRIAELHNARFWPKVGEGRTPASVSQQYLRLVNHDVLRIPGKLVELKALLVSAE